MSTSTLTTKAQWLAAAPTNVNVRMPGVLVLHTTWCTLDEAFARYQQGPVSAHYTIDRDGQLYQHVDELTAAHHAGQSYWHRSGVNQASVGIEVVNAAPTGPCATVYGGPVTPACGDSLVWEPIQEAQVQRLIGLCTEVLGRYPIDPFDVVGHSDVSPLRKEDPGPIFPWLRLARAGIGVAYDPQKRVLVHGEQTFALGAVDGQAAAYDAGDGADFRGANAALLRLQQQLAALGYDVPSHGACDHATQRALLAVNAHYLARFDAELSEETAAVVDGLWRWRRARQTARLAQAGPLVQ